MPTESRNEPFSFQFVQNNSKQIIKIDQVKKRTSNGLKDYMTLIKERKNATTAFTASDDSVKKMKVPSCAVSVGAAPIARWDTLLNRSYPLINAATISNNMRNEATARARTAMQSYISETLSPFNGQVFAGELRETINFLKSPLSSAINLTESLLVNLLKVKRGYTNTKVKPSPVAIANMWLEYRFAILPLISDISSIVDIINQKSSKLDTYKKRFYGFSEYATESSGSGSVGLNQIWSTRNLRTHYKAECFIHAGINFALLEEEITADEQFLRNLLDPSNLPSTFWELTPLSFLIDYFVNIGSIIGSSVNAHGVVSYTSESLVLTAEITESVPAESYNIRPGSVYKSINDRQSGLSVLKRRQVQRTASASVIPPLYVSLPGSTIRLANIAALLVSLNFSK